MFTVTIIFFFFIEFSLTINYLFVFNSFFFLRDTKKRLNYLLYANIDHLELFRFSDNILCKFVDVAIFRPRDGYWKQKTVPAMFGNSQFFRRQVRRPGDPGESRLIQIFNREKHNISCVRGQRNYIRQTFSFDVGVSK